MENNEILTIEELVRKHPKLFGRAKAYRLAATGRLPGLIKIGNRYRVSGRVIQKIIDEGWQPAPGD